jgi:dipicolinate synthase subunit A
MLKSNLTICFLGGDKRQRYAAEKLSLYAKINAVGECFSGCSAISRYESPIKAMYGAFVTVLPLPVAKHVSETEFDTIVKALKDNGGILLGGAFTAYMKNVLEAEGIRFYDYYEDECFTIRNAYLTAEGTLNIVMNELQTDIKGSSFAIFGYGRIGTALGEILKANGGDVMVYARRKEALMLAKERGLKTKIISHDNKIESKVVINTIPTRVISNEQLLTLADDTIIIELASMPGGFDFEIAEQCGLNAIKAYGLPGKYAPLSAGEAVADTILTILYREALL